MKNKFKVQERVWRKWTPEAQKLFNELYSSMKDQSIYVSPKMAMWVDWDVTRWNAAWMAASIASGLTLQVK